VKYVEAAGARAVPILADASRAELERIFAAVNGILLPGGSQDLRSGEPFYDAAAALWSMAVEANDKGDYFPVSECVAVHACVGRGWGGVEDAVACVHECMQSKQQMYHLL
jgi:hypothetical protein